MMRSKWFLAFALDTTKPSYERLAAWRLSDRHFWYESVMFHGLPIMLVPTEYIGQVRALVFAQHEGPITGTQIQR